MPASLALAAGLAVIAPPVPALAAGPADVAAPALPPRVNVDADGVAIGGKYRVDPTAFKVVDGRFYLNKDADVAKAWARETAKLIRDADGKWDEVARRPVDG